MNCKQCKELLAAYFEETIKASRKRAIDSHLSQCPHCREEARQITGLRRRLAEDSSILAQTNLAEEVLCTIIRDQNRNQKKVVRLADHSLWRVIMKSKITRLAAASVVIIIILIGISLFGRSVDMASIALGGVREAFLGRPWVHVMYDNGREEWMNISEGTHFYKSEFGWCFFFDRVLNTRLEYSRDSDHITKVTPKTYPEGNVPPWEPRIAWETALGFLEEGESRAFGRYTEIEKHADTVGGQDTVRFDIYWLDALDNRVLATQLWADPESRLPIRIRSRVTWALREITEVDYITGEYDFPDTGPDSILDLGVPPNLKVVSRIESDNALSSEVRQILMAGKKAAQEFPQQYRAVRWSGLKHGTIRVLYHSGKKVCYFNFFNLDGTKYPDCHLNMPATTMEILTWTEKQIPISVTVFDGLRVFRRSNWHPHLDINEQTSVRVNRVPPYPLPRWVYLENDFWPYVYAKNQPLELIADHPETPPGCVALSNGEIYYFVDPLLDYISVKMIQMIKKDGKQLKHMEFSLSDFVKLPTGHWYPQKKHSIYYKIDFKDMPPEQYENIDIQLLQEEELPLDLFDGERLLEGGVKVETY